MNHSLDQIRKVKKDFQKQESIKSEQKEKAMKIAILESDSQIKKTEFETCIKKLENHIQEIIQENPELPVQTDYIEDRSCFSISYKEGFRLQFIFTDNMQYTLAIILQLPVKYNEAREKSENRKFTVNDTGRLGWKLDNGRITDNFMTTDELINYWFHNLFMKGVIEDFWKIDGFKVI